jgi:peptidoglycan hydrolase CwlO-like protein
MIKKALMGTAIAAVVGGLVFGRDLFSYAKTAGNQVREAVKSEVPLDFQIDRARKLVEELVPEIRKYMHEIAEQQVEIERLTGEIGEKQARLDQQKDAVLALKADLASGKDTFVYASASRTYSADEVRRDLGRRFERFKVAASTLDKERQILNARQRTLEANQKKLEELLNSKQDLQVQIAELEARWKSIQAVESFSTLEIDDSRLARAKSLIAELDKQLDVKDHLLAAEGKLTGEIPVEVDAIPDETTDVSRQIDAYFGVTESPDVAANID